MGLAVGRGGGGETTLLEEPPAPRVMLQETAFADFLSACCPLVTGEPPAEVVELGLCHLVSLAFLARLWTGLAQAWKDGRGAVSRLCRVLEVTGLPGLEATSGFSAGAASAESCAMRLSAVRRTTELGVTASAVLISCCLMKGVAEEVLFDSSCNVLALKLAMERATELRSTPLAAFGDSRLADGDRKAPSVSRGESEPPSRGVCSLGSLPG
mmetsp:Transcript_17204/g.47994  ORF Transcript_17204/g.47994 Transcript_17204/m.47994 type:complete len:212 (+) Transcript_17204:10-645(+)